MAILSTRPNRFYPSIPGVTNDIGSHTNALQQVRESIETHERRNSNYLKSFIRFEELVSLGIIDEQGNQLVDFSTVSGGALTLGELNDVSVPAPVDNDILGFNAATNEWTAQNAAELGLATLADLAGIGGATNLGELTDVDLTGGLQFDLLYQTGAGWEPTKGELQFDGSDVYVPQGSIQFGAVGGTNPSVTGTATALQLDAPTGAIEVDAATYFDFINTVARFDANRGIFWQGLDGTTKEYLVFQSTTSIIADPFASQVQLFTDFEGLTDGTAFTELSQNAATTDPMDVDNEFNTGIAKFGTGAFYFSRGDGVSSNLGQPIFFPDINAYDMTNQDWTIEMWFRMQTGYLPDDTPINSQGGPGNGLISKWTSALNRRGFRWRIDNDNALEFNWSTTGNDFKTHRAQGTTWAADTWYHLAIVREGSEIRQYINGTRATDLGGNSAVGTDSIHSNDRALAIGSIEQAGANSSYAYGCYFDEVQLTIGTARYSADFTPQEVSLTLGRVQGSGGGDVFVVGDPASPTRIDGTEVTVSEDLIVNLTTTLNGTLGVTGVSTFLSNIDITGDIIVSGVVDGRDVAADGAVQDAHIADATIHFTQAAISITASQVSDFDTEVSNNTDVAANTAKPTPDFSLLQADSALSDVATAQAWCSATGQDVFTLQANSTYKFRGKYRINSGTVSHFTSIGFSVSGVVISSIEFNVLAWNGAANTRATGQSTTHKSAITLTQVTATNTNAWVNIEFEGILVCTTGGDITPQIQFSAAPGGTNLMKRGSYVEFERIGDNTIVQPGTGWS